MGHKKKISASRSIQTPSSVVVTAVDPCDVGESELSEISECGGKIVLYDSGKDLSSFANIKLECEKALLSCRRGSFTKAIRLIKETCARYQDSALVYRIQGTLFAKVAAVYEDPATKHKYMNIAIESARKALELSPSSIEFAHFYANLLYETANDGREFDEVVQECQRALSIENPIDPGRESLQDENQQKLSTPEARIEHVQEELRSLIQKSNISSLSSWMKTLGNGDDKFRLIPIRRIVEDPIESKLIQNRRPNEIKKAIKTPEERRKEIEVRVAAARYLQQKSDSSPSPNEGNTNSKGSDSTLGAGQRVGERRKHGNARKNGSTVGRKDWVRSYWNSMNKEMKKDLLRVSISDLKGHFSSSKDGQANEIITDALSFYEANQKWRFWVCCRCSKKFSSSEAHMQHVVQDHMGNVLPKMQMAMPQSIGNEWTEMLLNCSWKPLDLSAAVKLLRHQLKYRNCELLHCRDNMDDDGEPVMDAWEALPEKMNIGDVCNSITGDSSGSYENSSIGVNESKEAKALIPFPDEWPISNDPERAKLLEKIRAAFELLIGHKYLAASHLNKVMHFTLDELQSLVSVSQDLNRGLEQSPICICFLGAPQLRKILKFLQELSQSCGLSQYSDKIIPGSDANGGDLGSVVSEEIIFDSEGAILLLDEKFLGPECTQEKYMGSALDNVTVGSSRCIANSNDVSSGAEGFLSWIFAGPSSGEQILSWTRMKEDKTNQGLEIMQILEKEFCHLQSLGDRKCEHLSYEVALHAVEDFCLDEGRARETSAEFTHESYESLLRKRREELIESDHDFVFLSNRFEMEALTNVLKEAESLNHNQFGYEESYTGASFQLRDLESGEVDEWRMKDSLNQADSFIEIAIQKQKEQLSSELSKIDARMMGNVNGMQQLELKLGLVSSNDYQIVLLPLVKSCLRAHLEVLAEKDATEKSDAAREAFLIELALDSKKDARGKHDKSRHTHEKPKDKKKNKDNKKSKDSKATTGYGHHFNHDTVENSSLLVASHGSHSEAEVVSEAIDVIHEQEEEYRHRTEFEEEERNLETTLEFQRQIENEAKQNHLEEHQKCYGSLVSETAHNDDLDLLKNPIHQDNWNQTNGCLDALENHKVNTNGVLREKYSAAMSDTGKVQHGKSQKVVANGVATEACVSQSDQRTGRRGRRQKASNKLVNGKHHATPADNEKCESQRTSADSERQSETQLSNGEAGTKTLRQLQAEEDEEERFQADIKRAVRQSLDVYQAHRKIPTSLRPPREVNNNGILSDAVIIEAQDSSGNDGFGTGLQNEVGEYNCFLNVIIQSLWHLGRFRAEFLLRSALDHHHVGDPCAICALYEIFTALTAALTETRKEPVAPSSLRMALSDLYPESSFFLEAQMNDASEVLSMIFDCLHRSSSQISSVSDTESSESNCMGSWECTNRSCIAHSLFGMDIFEQMNCYSCGLESRHMKYTSFFHNINASALRTMKVSSAESSFEELLNLIEMNHQLACDPEAGGCGNPNYIHHILSSPPHVFAIVIGWQSTCETVEDIAATLAALNTEIDISIMYRGVDPKNTYSLVSVVCYYGQHYHCFAYSHDHDRWIMFDDKTVKVIGSWEKVVSMCERGHLQPQVLLYQKR